MGLTPNRAEETAGPANQGPAPLRVLLLDAHLRGGGQVRYLVNLAQQLVSAGHHVTMGCRKGSVLADHGRAIGCAVLDVFQFRGGLRPAAWYNDLRAMARCIRHDRPDIIHVSGSQDHWTAGAVNAALRRPVCIVRTRHNTYPVSDNPFNQLLNRSWTDFQVVVCNCVREDLARQRAFDGRRMCSIHNGVDAEAFRPDQAARESARAEFGYTADDVVCGIAARLVEAKGHEFLLRAAAMLKDACPNLRLLVLGQGALESELRTLAEELGLNPITTWAGFREDMARCVQAFDIGVQPSVDCDTSSFSLKEQMAAGKCVIASDYGGLTEIVSDGVEGLVVPAGTVPPLAQAMQALYDDPDRREQMGIAGRERVLREFTVQEFGRRTIDAYRKALEAHRERSSS